MRNKSITIAGTTVGGSSYTTRIIKVLSNMEPDARLTVIIGKGEKQANVYIAVNKQILQLYWFINKCNGKLKAKIEVELE